MDKYAELTKRAIEIRREAVEGIRETLAEKGYGIGDYAVTYTDDGDKCIFLIEKDRIIINGFHPDNLGTDDVLSALRCAMRIVPNM